MNINIAHECFNQLFWDLNSPEFKSKRWVICRGGSSSGKSFAITQYLVILAATSKQRILVTRKTLASLTDSVFFEIKKMLDLYHIPYRAKESPLYIKLLHNNSEFVFKGADDVAKFRSIGGITNIFIEEGAEYNKKDITEINRRVRGEDKPDAQIIIAFNPVSEDSYLKKMFYDTKRHDVAYSKTTYLDNKFLSKVDKEQLQILKDIDQIEYEVFALAEWGRIRTGLECYPHFDTSKHTKPIEYDPNKSIILGVDINSSPYCTILAFQTDNNKLHIIKEYCIRGLHLREAFLQFTNDFTDHKKDIILIADAASYAKDARLERGENAVNQMLGYLSKFKVINRTPRSNPSIDSRVRWINTLLKTDEIEFRIDSKCDTVIEEYNKIMFDANGKPSKARTTEKLVNGDKISYEKYGHVQDVVSYVICVMFNKEYKSFTSHKFSYANMPKSNINYSSNDY